MLLHFYFFVKSDFLKWLSVTCLNLFYTSRGIIKTLRLYQCMCREHINENQRPLQKELSFTATKQVFGRSEKQ